MNKIKSGVLYIVIAISAVIIIRNLVMWKKKDGLPSDMPFTEAAVNNKTIDLKKKKYKTPIAGTFEITNTGNSPLVIGNVDSDCHCTVPHWSKAPVLPGQSTTISVHYDSTMLGYFFRTIRVEMNAKNAPLVLAIKGEVIP